MTKILIIDDEDSIRNIVRMNLQASGFEVDEAPTAKIGLEKIGTFAPGLIVLDLGLPDKNGLEVLKEIRSWSNLPVIVLTVNDLESSKIDLLEKGADDYVTKPFSANELLARIRVALRHRMEVSKIVPSLVFSDFRVDLSLRKIFLKDLPLQLTATEFSLLRTLLIANGQIVSQEEILKQVWGTKDLGNLHYVRIYIAQLRKKIELDPASPKYILTEPGVGYRVV